MTIPTLSIYTNNALDLVNVVNSLNSLTSTHDTNISSLNLSINNLNTEVAGLVTLQSNLNSLFNAKMDKIGGTFTGTVYGTTFRANKGIPNASNSSTKGFAFDNDGDTGLFAYDGTSVDDTTKLAFYIQNSLKATIDSTGNINIVGTPTYDQNLTTKLYVDSSVQSAKTYFDSSKTNMILTGLTNVDVLGIGIPNKTPNGLLDIYTASSNSTYFRTDAPDIELRTTYLKTGGTAFTFGLDTSDNKFKLSSNQYSLTANNLLSIDSNGNSTLNGTFTVSTVNNSLGINVKTGSGQNSSGIGIDTNSNAYFSFKDSAGNARITGTTLDGSLTLEKLNVTSRSGVSSSVVLKSPTGLSSNIDIISNGRAVSYDWRMTGTTDNNSLEIYYGGTTGTGYGKKFAITSSGGIYSSSLWSTGPSAYINELSPRGYINFTVTGTTVTVNSSFNVSSLTRNGVGDYTVNFSVNLPSANYVSIANAVNSTGILLTAGDNITNYLKNASSYRFLTTNPSNNTNTEVKNCSIIFFGG